MQNMKRPAAHQPTLSSQPGFSAKRASPQSARGMGLALKLHLRPQRLTDVTGDVSNNGVREMILKPLGFYFERPLGCWRHDGSKRPEVWPPAGCAAAAPAAWPADPVAEILERAGRDGVTVQVVDCGRGVDKRAEGLPKASARAIYAQLNANMPPPAAIPPTTAATSCGAASGSSAPSAPPLIPSAPAGPLASAGPSAPAFDFCSDEALLSLADPSTQPASHATANSHLRQPDLHAPPSALTEAQRARAAANLAKAKAKRAPPSALTEAQKARAAANLAAAKAKRATAAPPPTAPPPPAPPPPAHAFEMHAAASRDDAAADDDLLLSDDVLSAALDAVCTSGTASMSATESVSGSSVGPSDAPSVNSSQASSSSFEML